ncbi:hypothetical protein GY45DRAFT_1329013 [Cubamyces sp. BRFM 1775]|nr:hypothetical protein GY45DRAFT_1329013 [Cubamyces sp. BRFM 1775]
MTSPRRNSQSNSKGFTASPSRRLPLSSCLPALPSFPSHCTRTYTIPTVEHRPSTTIYHLEIPAASLLCPGSNCRRRSIMVHIAVLPYSSVLLTSKFPRKAQTALSSPHERRGSRTRTLVSRHHFSSGCSKPASPYEVLASTIDAQWSRP